MTSAADGQGVDRPAGRPGRRPRPGAPARRIARALADGVGSGRLAVVLLTVLAVLLFLYLFIPQAATGTDDEVDQWVREMGPAGLAARLVGFTDLRRSGWLYATGVLLFLNLLLCMIRRLRAAAMLWRLPAAPPPVVPAWSHREVGGATAGPDDIARRLRARGYRTIVAGNTVYGLRGRLAVIGHWVFHVSLLLLLVVGAWVALRPDPFRGTLGLGEGESFEPRQAAFLGTNARQPPDDPGLRFAMESIRIEVDGEDVRRLEGLLSMPGGARARIGINRPFRHGSWQAMVHGFGYMPGWVIVDARGRMLGGAWVKLVPFPVEGVDTFRIGPKTSEVTVQLHPDHRPGDNGDADRGYELRNPRFRTTVRLLGEPIYEGLLAPGERVPLGDGREFFFLPEIRRYLLLDITRESEHRAVFAVLGLMILGLALRYARLRKEILVHVGGGSLQVHGHGELFEGLFEEELDRLAVHLGRETRT